MKVRELIVALKEYPQDAEVYVTDDGSSWLDSWASSVTDVEEDNTAGEGTGVTLTFDGFFLRSAIEQDA